MTSTASARRGTHQAGSRTWVVRHERHRARAGCSITGRPPGPRTVRRRPVPHRRNRAEHRGHANRPAARSATARSSSATTITPEVSIHACKPYPARDCGARGELVLRPARSDCPHPTVATPSRPADTLTTAGQPSPTDLAGPRHPTRFVLTLSLHTKPDSPSRSCSPCRRTPNRTARPGRAHLVAAHQTG